MTLNTSGFHLFLYRFDESIYIGITRCFCGIQFLTDHIVGIVLHILQREIFELTFQFIESEFMSQRGIEIGSLLRHFHFGFNILGITNLAHQVDAISNHNKNHPHILSKGEQQVTEILALHHRILLIELLDTVQTLEYTGHLGAILFFNLFYGNPSILYFRNQMNSLNGITFQAYLLFKDLGCLVCHLPLLVICKTE